MRPKTGMSESIDQGHYLPTSAPKLGKGMFQQVGTFLDEGELTSTTPKATSVNVKTGKLQNGENGF
jgi:hypothetical protein